LAAGVPAVFTCSGVAPEFIEPGRNAMVVPFQNQEAVYQAMRRLLQNESLRTRLAAQGRSDVQRLFTLETMIQQLEKLYGG
jgi:glycosyltransferase involved in cell wall biosynthesis